MKSVALRSLVALVLSSLLGPTVQAYPLDGTARTGIRRLDAARSVQQGKHPGLRLPAGALIDHEDVRLHLAGVRPGWDPSSVPPDATLQAALDSVFEGRDPSYGVLVIDYTDPDAIAWAGRRAERSQYPGSVGKVACMVALFDGLRRAFPDVDERLRVLREVQVEATDWAVGDSHSVPHVGVSGDPVKSRPIARGDRFSLAEWVDHMVSASANSAGSTVWKEAILLRRFGAEYPVSAERESAFFRETSKSELQRMMLAVIEDPFKAAGLDTSQIRQGSMWTRAGKERIPGVGSHATPFELARMLLRLEQGRLVDAWSSLEMKRYLYFTRKRYRYVYAPELANAAVYFKSGSLYACEAEPGFKCGKYRGNKKNFMNSIAIVETPGQAGAGQRRYLVALVSNILRVNSAWDHSRIAAAIDEAVQTRKRVRVKQEGSETQVAESGRSE